MRSWIDSGLHGEMGYLERHAELRAGSLDHPNLLRDARSVVVVALSYNFPVDRPRVDGRSRGVVARYAHGEDYHTVFRKHLKSLSRWLTENFPSELSRGFTDSGPIRERELARRCGLGWQGKHTNLISLDLGNWFLIGALLTTLELQPDSPVEAHCGTCTRCIDACPTAAIIAPQTLDARRCISYLTIEIRGSIPVELRPLIGDRIFGCDDCLAVCPWNERAQLGKESRFAARNTESAYPDLLKLLDQLADEESFRARFASSPLLRPGRDGLRRNVCVALGNVGGPESLAALHGVARTDSSEMVREHALWAVEQIKERAAG